LAFYTVANKLKPWAPNNIQSPKNIH
jgi:hypothetical protein